jgi:membrane-bound lytic murein transglycosylase F
LNTSRHKPTSSRAGNLILAGLVLLLLILQGCEQTPLTERLQARGTLHVATVAGPLSCHLGLEGPAGLEYELVNRFAGELGLSPVFTVYANRQEAMRAVQKGRQDMAAGFIVPPNIDDRAFHISSAIVQTRPRFVHFMSRKRFDIHGTDHEPIAVPANGYADRLLTDRELAPERLEGIAEESVLALVDMGLFNYSLTNEAQLKAHANFLPRLVSGNSLASPLSTRWLFARFYDSSLKDRANAFLRKQAEEGFLQELQQEYIDQLPGRNFVTRRDFWKHVQQRLPRYIELFRQAGAESGIDWRLLAAIGYQESHWNAKAKSPTGVRGIMMLTLATARQQKISDRLDPAQSIPGGARHLLWMEKRIPDHIQGKDLLWFTLASYNIGYGHLEDARVLTERQGGNPDKWSDVKQRLPLLSQKKYYNTLKHGRARGGEPVAYVENIRYFYRLLVLWDNAEQGLDCTSETAHRRLALKN